MENWSGWRFGWIRGKMRKKRETERKVSVSRVARGEILFISSEIRNFLEEIKERFRDRKR